MTLFSLWMNTMKRCFLMPLALVTCSAALAQNTPELPTAPSQTYSTSTRQLPPEAQALGRQFPMRTQRGELVVVQFPDITINGKPARLSPGSRVRDTSNRIVVANTLANQKFLVNFTQEPTSGLIHDVWLLTADEARRKLPSVLAAEAARAGNATNVTN
jgi:hypothetical protein